MRSLASLCRPLLGRMTDRTVLIIPTGGLRTGGLIGCAWVILVALGACMVLAGPVRAETSATITPQLSPDRLGARGAVGIRVQFADPSQGVPAPVRRMVLRFPAGMTLDLPHLSSCSAARLRARGPHGCPAASALGRGHALVRVRLGSQTTSENISMWVFLGPLRNIQPTVVVLARGYTPFDEQVVFRGSLVADVAPYGEQLVMSIPPIKTLPLEPYGSIVTFSLTVGVAKPHRKHDQNTVTVPSTCPLGGFPLAGEFTYADGSGGSAASMIRCP